MYHNEILLQRLQAILFRLTSLVLVALCLTTSWAAFAQSEMLQGAGGRPLNASAEEVRRARAIITEKCREIGLYGTITMSRSRCLALASEGSYSLVAVQQCQKRIARSYASFVSCLEVSKDRDIPSELYEVCEPVREGAHPWLLYKDCLSNLARSTSSYNKKVYQDCYRLIGQHSGRGTDTRSCLNVIRDRNIPDDSLSSCMQINGESLGVSNLYKAVECMEERVISAPLSCSAAAPTEATRSVPAVNLRPSTR